MTFNIDCLMPNVHEVSSSSLTSNSAFSSDYLKVCLAGSDLKMRLLHLESGNLSLTEDYTENVPPYAILSHTWGKDTEEVNFDDFKAGTYTDKTGYRKIQFCGEQAARDEL